jgi:soluble lytic murein transglycosylase
VRAGFWQGMVVVWGLAMSLPVQANPDFIAAREAYRNGDNQTVAERAEALSRDPLGIYPRYWLLTRQVETATSEQMLPFLKYYHGAWLAEKLRSEWLVVLGRKGDWPLFRQQYALLLDTPSQELRCYAYAARLEAGDSKVLAEARNTLWFTAKDLPSACDTVLQSLQASSELTDADRWARLRLALTANAQGLARHLAGQLGRTLQASELQTIVANPAKYLDGVSMDSRLDRELAVFAFVRLARTDVEGTVRRLERMQARLGDEPGAFAWQQLGLSGARKLDRRALDWMAQSDGRTSWSDEALESRIRMALRAENWELVLSSIRQLSDATRQLRPWQYWEARALEVRKAMPGANRIFAMLSLDDDYYGLLARDRLGPLMGPVNAAYTLTEEDRRLVKTHAGLQRALTLNALGFRTEAVREWNWSVRGADDRLLLAAAEAANEAGWYDRAIYAADRTKRLHNYSLRYLAPYREVTRGYAQELGLDEAWVYGLIRQESRFVTSARSSVGAGGLMQVMPATAQWVANRIGMKYHAGMVNEVGTNVQLGTYYMKHVLDSLSSQPVLATAGYNAGPSRARAWQPADAPMEAALYVESIPFLETRDYVKKVMANAVAYSMTFGEKRVALTTRLGVIPPRNTPLPEELPNATTEETVQVVTQ